MLTITKLGVYQKSNNNNASYYLLRRHDAELRTALQQFTSHDLPVGQGGFLIVSGSNGVGKTACVANLVDSDGGDFLRQNCRLSTVVWFDLATLLIDVAPGSRQRFLLNKLATTLNVVPANSVNEEINATTDDQIIPNFDENINQNDDKVLLVFDHIDCLESLKFVSEVSVYNRFRCLLIDGDQVALNRDVLFKDQDKNLQVKTVEIRELTLFERKQMLKALLANKSIEIAETEINRLAGLCGGLPPLLHFIDGLLSCYKPAASTFYCIANRLSLVHASCADAGGECKNNKIACELMRFVFSCESLLKFARRYFAFLLFPPGQPVDIFDLALLWNCQDVDEALTFCQEQFVARNMAVEMVSNDTANCFSINPALHAAAMEFAKNHFGTRAFSLLFNLILTNAAKKEIERRKGENILHLAVRLGRYRLVEAIMANGDRGINVLSLLTKKSSSPDQQVTPLSLLFANNHIYFELILSIFDRIALMKTTNWLATRRRLSVLTKIHQHLVTETKKEALLEIAVQRNFFGMAKFLLEELFPANQRPQQKDCDVALIRAVTSENAEIVKLLLQNEADADASSPSGRSALMISISSRNATIVRMLLDGSANPNTHESIYYDTALIEASRNGLPLIVNLLLVSRAHPDMRNRNGETALMAAAMSGHATIVELLLFDKADPNARDNRGRTALMRACEKGSHRIVALLLERGADPNTMGQLPNPFNGAKCTALSLALAHGHITVARLLLKNGANSRKDTRLGVEALTAAIRSRNQEAIQLLLDYGVDVNATLPEGKTMLMLACELGEFSTDFVQTLLEINADANRVDRHGETAFSYCYRKYVANPLSRQNIEKLLLVIRASCPESFRGVVSVVLPNNNNGERPASTVDLLTSFPMITHSVTRLEKMCALRVRKLLGAGYVSNKLDRLILPDVIKNVVLLKQQ